MSTHGFTPPVPDGATLDAEDCPRCGHPTLIGEHYGVPYVMHQRGSGGRPLYVRHVCPHPMESIASMVSSSDERL
jgi:ribosomal protein S27AE